MKMSANVKDPRTHAIIGAAMEVHRHLGPGFLESVYHRALAVELHQRGVPFAQEVELEVIYKGRRLDVSYRADFICFESILVEVKALRELGALEEAQVLNYLKATGLDVGLLLNFGGVSLQYKRFALSRNRREAVGSLPVEQLMND